MLKSLVDWPKAVQLLPARQNRSRFGHKGYWVNSCVRYATCENRYDSAGFFMQNICDRPYLFYRENGRDINLDPLFDSASITLAVCSLLVFVIGIFTFTFSPTSNFSACLYISVKSSAKTSKETG